MDKPPLWMPQGSVRSLLAMLTTIAYIVSVMSPVIDDVPLEVELLVLGFYFATRPTGK